MTGNNDEVKVCGLFLQRDSGKAYGVSFAREDTDVEVWIAKSEVINDDLFERRMEGEGNEAFAVVPRWMAERNNLNYEEMD
jgi:hypothetical protein